MLYSTLALTERHLSRHAYEFVWLGVLISCERSLGSHHVKRFLDAGGGASHLGLATAISAMAEDSEGYLFVGVHWVHHLLTANAGEEYFVSFAQVIGAVRSTLAYMTASTVYNCSGKRQGLK